MKFKLANVALSDGPTLLAANPEDQRIATVASGMLELVARYVKRHPIGDLKESQRAVRSEIFRRFPDLDEMDVRKAAALAEFVAEAMTEC